MKGIVNSNNNNNINSKFEFKFEFLGSKIELLLFLASDLKYSGAAAVVSGTVVASESSQIMK